MNNSKNTPFWQTSVYRQMLNAPLFLLALYLYTYKIFIEYNSNGDCDINMNEFKFENALQWCENSFLFGRFFLKNCNVAVTITMILLGQLLWAKNRNSIDEDAELVWIIKSKIIVGVKLKKKQ